MQIMIECQEPIGGTPWRAGQIEQKIREALWPQLAVESVMVVPAAAQPAQERCEHEPCIEKILDDHSRVCVRHGCKWQDDGCCPYSGCPGPQPARPADAAALAARCQRRAQEVLDGTAHDDATTALMLIEAAKALRERGPDMLVGALGAHVIEIGKGGYCGGPLLARAFCFNDHGHDGPHSYEGAPGIADFIAAGEREPVDVEAAFDVEAACKSWHGENHWRDFTDGMKSVYLGNMRAAFMAGTRVKARLPSDKESLACAHDIHAPHKVGYGSTWCPGVAEKLGPMTPKELQQVEGDVVARYFPHLRDDHQHFIDEVCALLAEEG